MFVNEYTLHRYTSSERCSQYRTVPRPYSPATKQILELLVKGLTYLPYLLLLCLPCLGVSVLSALCDEAVGHSEGAQPSVISMYPFREKLEHACVE